MQRKERTSVAEIGWGQRIEVTESGEWPDRRDRDDSVQLQGGLAASGPDSLKKTKSKLSLKARQTGPGQYGCGVQWNKAGQGDNRALS